MRVRLRQFMALDDDGLTRSASGSRIRPVKLPAVGSPHTGFGATRYTCSLPDKKMRSIESGV
jgi:hypothetical protein